MALRKRHVHSIHRGEILTDPNHGNGVNRTGGSPRELHASLDPNRFATELLDAPAMTVEERNRWLRLKFESSPIRALFVDLDEFEEAVEDGLRNLLRASRDVRPRGNPDGTIAVSKNTGLKPLPVGDRNLSKLLVGVAERARDLRADELAAGDELAQRLNVSELPVRFSRRPNAYAWAYWNSSLKAALRAVR